MSSYHDYHEQDFTKLKYVLYVRKSSEEKERQIRSLDDQINDCEKFIIQRYKLKCLEIIRESKSAKTPGQRPELNRMLNDIKKGKHDGIIAWNPDRLSRNMLEGGEILHLIDEGIIKDLKFVTHHFTIDANGKMLLGMVFVLSKQYSDDLSQKVRRGVSAKFSEGKGSIYKHGYILDKDYYYRLVSGRQDSNLRPHGPKPRALPTELRPDTLVIIT